jgi:multicomponent Na+:H+ antiporter subunit E
VFKKLFPLTIFALILAIVWFAFSGNFQIFYLTLGLSSIILVFITIRKMHDTPEHTWVHYFNWRLPVYLVWLIYEIIKSAIEVSTYIWQKNPDIQPEFLWIESHQTDVVGTTIYASSITLTPGTVSVKINKNKIYVHSLTENAREGLRSNIMAKKVLSIREAL